MIVIEDSNGRVQKIARIEKSGHRVRAVYICSRCDREYSMGGHSPYSSVCQRCRLHPAWAKFSEIRA